MLTNNNDELKFEKDESTKVVHLSVKLAGTEKTNYYLPIECGQELSNVLTRVSRTWDTGVFARTTDACGYGLPGEDSAEAIEIDTQGLVFPDGEIPLSRAGAEMSLHNLVDNINAVLFYAYGIEGDEAPKVEVPDEWDIIE